MSGTLAFAGAYASAYGLRIGGMNVYKTTGNAYESAKVPGRMGDVIYTGTDPTVGNELREYNAGLYMRASSASDVEKRLAQIRDWLLNTRSGSYVSRGYKTLSDSYEPDFYRLAVFSGDVVPVRKGAGQNFEIPLTFSCDPRRYLANIEATVMASGAAGALTATIAPPQAWSSLVVFPAKPLIKFEGGYENDATSLTFTDSTFTEEIGKISFAQDIGTVYFDCETLNATSQPYGGANLNAWITDVTGNVTLQGLTNYVKRPDVDSKITITPRWWVR